ncbi:MAG TPA: hypothetical protein VMR86_07010 [Myxococcota bacterium]|nr:hypothetical protein [Myxococcota bacterium]
MRATLVVIALLVAGGTATLDQELARLHVHTALVIAAPGVDEPPLWSPGSDRLAASVAGRWRTVDLGHVLLQEGKLRPGLRIGMVASQSSVSESSSAPPWKGLSRASARRIALKSGIALELRPEVDELSTSLILTRPGKPSQIVWTSDHETCHTLVAALDDQHVAFVCDGNGVFVIRPGDIPEGGAHAK